MLYERSWSSGRQREPFCRGQEDGSCWPHGRTRPPVRSARAAAVSKPQGGRRLCRSRRLEQSLKLDHRPSWEHFAGSNKCAGAGAQFSEPATAVNLAYMERVLCRLWGRFLKQVFFIRPPIASERIDIADLVSRLFLFPDAAHRIYKHAAYQRQR